MIASSTRIDVAGTIRANGGNGNIGGLGTAFNSGGGSGGAIRLVAPRVTGAGALEAVGGRDGGSGPQAGAGKIRLESFTIEYTGSTNPQASLATAPGPVTAAGNPALVNLPTLRISSVGGIAPPPTPTGSYATADVSLPPDSADPVVVAITATHTPTNRLFTVRVIPEHGAPTTFLSTRSSGTFETSTATAEATLPAGQVSLVLAFGTFTLPQIASLLPVIDGEPVDRVLVAAAYGGPSTLYLVTRSGREIRADALPPADQVKLANAFEALKTIRQ